MTHPALTDRQSDILDALRRGVPRSDVPEAVHWSHATVAREYRAIRRRLGVRSLEAALVVYGAWVSSR